MDAFSYLSVLLSIILGLAIAQVLQGYRSVLLARDRAQVSAPVLIWGFLILLFAAQAWWASFGLRERQHWDFLAFAVILLQMVLLYMLSAVVFPDFAPTGKVDLIEHSGVHRRTFFGFLIAMLIVSVAKDVVLDHRLPTTTNLAFHLLFVAMSVIGIVWASARVQLALAIGAVAVFIAYIAVLFAQI